MHTFALLLAFSLGVFINNKGRFNAEDPKRKSLIIEGTLLSLLLGFTFNSAYDKNVSRKKIFTDEINEISSTYNTANLYPDSLRIVLQNKIKLYAISRKKYYEVSQNPMLVKSSIEESARILNSLSLDVAYFSKKNNELKATQQMFPHLNELSSIASIREMLRTTRVPMAALKLLLLISGIVSLLMGLNSQFIKSDWLSSIGFSLLISMTLYLILDLDTAEIGAITLDDQQMNLIALIAKFEL
jgi:predicted membrane chloride channel (bestrophin family)